MILVVFLGDNSSRIQESQCARITESRMDIFSNSILVIFFFPGRESFWFSLLKSIVLKATWMKSTFEEQNLELK